ncbi:DUF6527 family protein [Polaromonas aquatica]|uniref:DUF6527 family protein n=1 Tax=Polaromonas aquatica TaxID=332657 RepID=UPI003D64D323
MRSFLRKIAQYFWGLFKTQSDFTVLLDIDIPDEIKQKKLYLIGTENYYWVAVLRCPCGCGSVIQLPMSLGSRPCWQFSGTAEKPSLYPSVNRTVGCRSHFILRSGNIKWCH